MVMAFRRFLVTVFFLLVGVGCAGEPYGPGGPGGPGCGAVVRVEGASACTVDGAVVRAAPGDPGVTVTIPAGPAAFDCSADFCSPDGNCQETSCAVAVDPACGAALVVGCGS